MGFVLTFLKKMDVDGGSLVIYASSFCLLSCYHTHTLNMLVLLRKVICYYEPGALANLQGATHG